MTTLVIFRLPDNTFVSCDLGRLAAFPATGHVYLFNKQQFEVTEAVEPLTSGGGHSQIMDLVNLEFDNAADAAAALASMVNLDARLEQKVALAVEPDKVILVRLRKPMKGGGKSKIKVPGAGGFTLDIQGLLSGAPQPSIEAGSGKSRRRRRGTSSGS